MREDAGNKHAQSSDDDGVTSDDRCDPMCSCPQSLCVMLDAFHSIHESCLDLRTVEFDFVSQLEVSNEDAKRPE